MSPEFWLVKSFWKGGKSETRGLPMLLQCTQEWSPLMCFSGAMFQGLNPCQSSTSFKRDCYISQFLKNLDFVSRQLTSSALLTLESGKYLKILSWPKSKGIHHQMRWLKVDQYLPAMREGMYLIMHCPRHACSGFACHPDFVLHDHLQMSHAGDWQLKTPSDGTIRARLTPPCPTSTLIPLVHRMKSEATLLMVTTAWNGYFTTNVYAPVLWMNVRTPSLSKCIFTKQMKMKLYLITFE